MGLSLSWVSGSGSALRPPHGTAPRTHTTPRDTILTRSSLSMRISRFFARITHAARGYRQGHGAHAHATCTCTESTASPSGMPHRCVHLPSCRARAVQGQPTHHAHAPYPTSAGIAVPTSRGVLVPGRQLALVSPPRPPPPLRGLLTRAPRGRPRRVRVRVGARVRASPRGRTSPPRPPTHHACLPEFPATPDSAIGPPRATGSRSAQERCTRRRRGGVGRGGGVSSAHLGPRLWTSSRSARVPGADSLQGSPRTDGERCLLTAGLATR